MPVARIFCGGGGEGGSAYLKEPGPNTINDRKRRCLNKRLTCTLKNLISPLSNKRRSGIFEYILISPILVSVCNIELQLHENV